MRVALVLGVAIAVPGLLPRKKRIPHTAPSFVTELFLAGLTFGWFSPSRPRCSSC